LDPVNSAEASAIEAAADIERAFQAVADRVSPSVVGIKVQRRYVVPALPGDGGKEGTGDGRAQTTFEQWVVVNGSGMVIGADGLILTNEHVIQSAADIEIALWDGRRLPATVVSSDPRSDLAVLRVESEGLQPVRFAEPKRVRRGQWAIALGNPYGLAADGRACLSTGVVSNLGRRLPGLGESDDRFYHNMLQTTAAINPGNSGGALFNLRGEVLGIITAMHTRATEGDGVGFAIPMTPVKASVVERLRRGESIVYGYVGLSVRDPRPDERRTADREEPAGAIVDDVLEGGPGAECDIRAGDLLLTFDTQPVQSAAHLAELIGAAPVGSRVRAEVQRGRRSIGVEIEVARRDASHRD
jgi:serine protease DegQ